MNNQYGNNLISLASNLYEELEAVYEASPQRNPRFLPIGFNRLNELSRSIVRGNLYVIGGAKAYKNKMLFLRLVNHILQTNKEASMILSFQCESDVIDWGRRFLALKSSTPYSKLIDGNLSSVNWRALACGAGKMADTRVSIIQGVEESSKIIYRCHTIASETGGLEYIAIDNLQKTKSEWTCNNIEVWKKLAIELDVPVIVVSKSNRGLPVPKWDVY